MSQSTEFITNVLTDDTKLYLNPDPFRTQVDNMVKLYCTAMVNNVHPTYSVSDSQELTTMFDIIDRTLFPSDVGIQGGRILTSLLDMGMEFSINFSDFDSNMTQRVSARTIWSRGKMEIQLNSTLRQYLEYGSQEVEHFYYAKDRLYSRKCVMCKSLHHRQTPECKTCLYKHTGQFRKNKVGNVSCVRIGCLLETAVHEYCHVVEFLYRHVTKDKHDFGAHHSMDDGNVLFLKVRNMLTDHTSCSNNLLHTTMQ